MTSGIFVLISYVPTSSTPSGNGTAIPALNSVGETAGTSISVNYWVQNSISNSGTTTVTLPVNQNGSLSDVSFSTSTSGWAISSGTVTGSYTTPDLYVYEETNPSGTVGLILPLTGYSQDNSEGVLTHYYSVGTVTIGVTIDGQEVTVSHTFNTAGEITNNANAGYIEVAFSSDMGLYYGNYPVTFSVQITSDSGNTITQLFDSTTSSSSPSNFYTYSGSANSIILDDSSQPSEAAQPLIYGFDFGSTSTSFTIPQYESSFGISWSSSSSANPQYNSQSPSGTSGTLTGSLTSNSFDIYPVGDPPDVNSNGDSTYTFSYYLSSQYQVSSASATQTAKPDYNYTQVSGTTNEASASFSFSGSTPSTAVFEAYESGTNSLSTDSTNIVFTPTITVQNPYYTYTQNQLVASLSGASTGSYTYYHNFTGTYQGTFSQTYSPYITVTNVPNPASNGLSGLTTTGSSTSYTFGMVDNPSPSPDTILKVGQAIYMNLSATNLIISGATVSVNGLSPSSATLVYQKGSVYDFKYSSSRL